jgi:hypothetical protein
MTAPHVTMSPRGIVRVGDVLTPIVITADDRSEFVAHADDRLGHSHTHVRLGLGCPPRRELRES